MTKTLTEQWKDGTLDQRYYYVQYNGNPKPFVEIELKNFLCDLAKAKDSDKIEVLAPVPSYDKCKRLQEQLNEANEVIKWYDGVESILIPGGWKLMTGHKTGTAHSYLKKWGVK